MVHEFIQTQVAYAVSDVATIVGTAKPITHADFGWGTDEIETAEVAYISVSLAGIRLTWDGSTTPTTTVGMFIPENTTIAVTGTQNINNLNFIRSTGVSAALSITLEK